MPNLTPLGWMFLAWGIVTILLVLLLIYRSIVGMKEEDQLFLDASESHFEKEQQGILGRLELIWPYIKGLSYASGALLLTMAGVIAYRVMKAL
jgi:hypothetical protein